MILKRRVALNGEQLDELDNRIIITGIDEAAGKDNISAVSSAYGFGQRVIRKRRDSLDVTVKFALNLKNDTPGHRRTRETLLEKINTWACKGGVMTLDNRSNRQLYVMLAQAPGSGDMFNWTNEFTMVFRAYAVPYWEDTRGTTNSSGMTKADAKTSGSFYLTVPGNTDTEVELTVRNWSGSTINTLTLTVGGKQIKFTNLGLGGSDVLVIDHLRDAGMYVFRAQNKGSSTVSVLDKRSGADDFTVSPGKRKISFSAQRAVTVTATVRGRYI